MLGPIATQPLHSGIKGDERRRHDDDNHHDERASRNLRGRPFVRVHCCKMEAELCGATRLSILAAGSWSAAIASMTRRLKLP